MIANRHQPTAADVAYSNGYAAGNAGRHGLIMDSPYLLGSLLDDLFEDGRYDANHNKKNLVD